MHEDDEKRFLVTVIKVRIKPVVFRFLYLHEHCLQDTYLIIIYVNRMESSVVYLLIDTLNSKLYIISSCVDGNIEKKCFVYSVHGAG